jgi:hypothetical protein
MDDKSHSQIPKKITSKNIFKAKIEKVWEVLMDHEFLFKNLFEDMVISYEFQKENRCDKLGVEFKVICKDYSLLFKCTELINDEHFKKINYYVSPEIKVLDFSHNFTYTLISNTIEASTIFIWDYEFDKPEILQISTETIEKYKQSRYICVKRWSEHISKMPGEILQFESIQIDSTRKEIWDVITNWCVLRTVSPDVADEIQYKGNQLNVGSQIKLIFNIKRKFVCDLRVVKVNCDMYSQDWEYVLECYDSCPKVPFQEIKFSLVFLKLNKCFLIFQHVFKESLDHKVIHSISAQKKTILKNIKNYLEK